MGWRGGGADFGHLRDGDVDVRSVTRARCVFVSRQKRGFSRGLCRARRHRSTQSVLEYFTDKVSFARTWSGSRLSGLNETDWAKNREKWSSPSGLQGVARRVSSQSREWELGRELLLKSPVGYNVSVLQEQTPPTVTDAILITRMRGSRFGQAHRNYRCLRSGHN